MKKTNINIKAVIYLTFYKAVSLQNIGVTLKEVLKCHKVQYGTIISVNSCGTAKGKAEINLLLNI